MYEKLPKSFAGRFLVGFAIHLALFFVIALAFKLLLPQMAKPLGFLVWFGIPLAAFSGFSTAYLAKQTLAEPITTDPDDREISDAA